MNPPRTLAGDDYGLMAQVQAGDLVAFDRLYDRFSSQAYNLAWRISQDRGRADDIVQEAFLSIWRSRATFRPAGGSPAGWIMGVVRNRALDSHRRNARHDVGNAGDSRVDELTSADGAVEDDVIGRDEAARLRVALATLPAAQRDVITLAYYGELSTSEIAAELSLPLGTVKGRMRLGLHKLSDRVRQ